MSQLSESPAGAGREPRPSPRESALCCPACGSGEIREPWRASSRFSYRACDRCGHLTRVGPRRVAFSIPDEARYLRWPWVYRLLRWYDARRIRSYKPILARHPAPAVLDVGAGPALTAHTFRALGIPYVGVEPNSHWRRLVPESGAEVIQATLAGVPPEVLARSNVILMFHVIEHIARPSEALTPLVSHSPEGAHVIIRTPNADALGARLWRRSWYPLCPDEHPLVYSKASLLRAVIAAGGFHVESIRDADGFGDTLLSSYRGLLGLTGSPRRALALTFLLSPLIVAADVATGVLSLATGRTHEVELVCRKRAGRRPFFSFIIPAYNERNRIGRAVDAIRRSAEAAGLEDAVEIIVVDNASTDGTAAIAAGRGARVVFQGERNVAKARNTGAAHASGQYLIFIDADTEADEGFCRELIAAIARYWPDAAGVRLLVNDDGGAWPARVGRLVLGMLRVAFGSSFSVFILRREAYERHGGFDEGIYAYEDVHWLVKMKLLGYCGRARRYRVLGRLKATVSSRAALRRGMTSAYLKHLFFPWLRYRKRSCDHWYRREQSD